LNRQRPITRERSKTPALLHNKAEHHFKGWQLGFFLSRRIMVKGTTSQVTKAGFLISKMYTGKWAEIFPE